MILFKHNETCWRALEGKYSLDIFYSNLDSLRRVSRGAHLIAAGIDRYPAASETENRWSGLMHIRQGRTKQKYPHFIIR